MNSENLFEYAARTKMRFETVRGFVSVEDLWDMPLTSRANNFDLDTVAKTINRQLKAVGEESFVNTGSNPRTSMLEIQLNIVKHVIATIQRENTERLARAGRKAERDRLLEILESKEQSELMNMTPDQIRARIAELEV